MILPTKMITSRLLRDDLARVEVPTGVHRCEQSVDHVYARSGDVLLQPRGMLGPDGVMVRQGAAESTNACWMAFLSGSY